MTGRRPHVHVFVFVNRPSGAIVQKCACGQPSPNPPLMLSPISRRLNRPARS